MAASIVDMTLYVVNNYKALQKAGSSIVLYLPKIQTAGEAALWNDMLSALGDSSRLAIREPLKYMYWLNNLEATYQLMEIRAALGKHFVDLIPDDGIISIVWLMRWPGIKFYQSRY